MIFAKYKDLKWPTHCERDVLTVVGFKKGEVSDEDAQKLDELDFFWSDSDSSWQSFYFGSS